MLGRRVERVICGRPGGILCSFHTPSLPGLCASSFDKAIERIASLSFLGNLITAEWSLRFSTVTCMLPGPSASLVSVFNNSLLRKAADEELLLDPSPPSFVDSIFNFDLSSSPKLLCDSVSLKSRPPLTSSPTVEWWV